MPKNQPPQQGLALHYFSLLPLSLSFTENRSADFSLMFENDLVAAQYDTLALQGASTRRYFEADHPIQYFKLASVDGFSIRWSLFKQDGAQQLIQSQATSLRPQWTEFLQSRRSVIPMHMSFQSSRCQFKYLLIIAKSSREIQERIREYKKTNKQCQRNLSERGFKQLDSEQEEMIETIESVHRYRVGQFNAARRGVGHQPKGNALLSNKTASPFNSHKSIKYANDYEINVHLSRSNETETEEEMKLSLSQLEICNEIENEIREYERKKESEKEGSKNISEITLTLHNSEIQMVQSHLLNSRHDIVISPSTQKWILLFVIVLLLLAGSAILNFNAETYSIKRTKPPKSKPVSKERAIVQGKKNAPPNRQRKK